MNSRFDRTRSFEDWDEAVAANKSILTFLYDASERGRYLSHLGWQYQTRFQKMGALTDLDEGIAFFDEAVRLTPKSHIRRSLNLMLLGKAMEKRMDASNSSADCRGFGLLAKLYLDGNL